MIRKDVFAENVKNMVSRSRWLGASTAVEPIADGWALVHTKLLFTDGESLSVNVMDQDGKYQLTDFGLMYDMSTTRGVLVKRATNLIKQTASIRGLNSVFIKRGNKHSLSITTNSDNFDSALMDIASAMVSIDTSISLKEFGGRPASHTK